MQNATAWIWTLGPSVSLPLFAGGRNAANLSRAKDRYEESVARYRQRVLVAFGEVENALAGIRLLEEQAAAQERAVRSAGRAHELARESFTTGITDYLDVIDADRAALQTLRTALCWKQGRFWFRQQPAEPASFAPRSIGSLLLEATRQNDESFANVG